MYFDEVVENVGDVALTRAGRLWVHELRLRAERLAPQEQFDIGARIEAAYLAALADLVEFRLNVEGCLGLETLATQGIDVEPAYEIAAEKSFRGQ
ncbi:hypothetical protein [Microbacterium sp. NPDC056234]|uniref:hypothetical protein n=1 Tax=Microbacterium sp. NPDC056234 TaxID=3345757 RepID=UPI0035DCAD7D